jgi:hypothetical protein
MNNGLSYARISLGAFGFSSASRASGLWASPADLFSPPLEGGAGGGVGRCDGFFLNAAGRLRVSPAGGGCSLGSCLPPFLGGLLSLSRDKESNQRKRAPVCARYAGSLCSSAEAGFTDATSCRDGEGFGILPRPASMRGQSPPRPAVLGADKGGEEKQTTTARSAALRRFAFCLLLLISGPLDGAEHRSARRGRPAGMPVEHRRDRMSRRCGAPSTREAQGTRVAGAITGCAFFWQLFFAQAKKSMPAPQGRKGSFQSPTRAGRRSPRPMGFTFVQPILRSGVNSSTPLTPRSGGQS